MASISLSAMQKLTINPTDSNDVLTLKNTYNTLLGQLQTKVNNTDPNSITARFNALQSDVTQFNTMLKQLNDVATGLSKIQLVQTDSNGNLVQVPAGVNIPPVAGTQTVSTLTISVIGSVTLT